MTLSLISSNYKDTLNVKLNGIKTPLLRQGYGHSVREYVVKALSNKRLYIVNNIEYSSIKYVEILIDSNILFNIKMLKDGWAWYDSSILKNNDYVKAENYAKRSNLGLWYYEAKKPWSLY
jgi:endonuclease YncB( thermonuclease family)